MVAPPVKTQQSFENYLSQLVELNTQSAVSMGPLYEQLWLSIATLSASGKRIRPTLLLTVFDAYDGIAHDAALKSAAALELLHIALLMHDDIVDQDLERRGHPNSIQVFRDAALHEDHPSNIAQRWGEANALLGGDLLISLAYKLMALIDAPFKVREHLLSVFEESVQHAASGEQLDLAYGLGIRTPTLEDLRTMMHRKTSVYSFQAPLMMGAILAYAPPTHLHTLSRIGDTLGQIFQMTDDLLGVFGNPSVTGKSASTDIVQGKETMLIVYARQHEGWEEYRHLWADPNATEEQIDSFRAFLVASGSRQRTEELVNTYISSCSQEIRQAQFPPALQEHLLAFTTTLGGRLS